MEKGKKVRNAAEGFQRPPESSKCASKVSNSKEDSTETDPNQTSAEVSQTICSFCHLNLPGEWVVQCDDCDRYFHFNCVGYEPTNPDERWSCPVCAGKVLSSTARSEEPNTNTNEVDRTELRRESNSARNEKTPDVTAEIYQELSLALSQEYFRRCEQLLSEAKRRSGGSENRQNPNPSSHINDTHRTVERNTGTENSKTNEFGDEANSNTNRLNVDRASSKVTFMSSKAQTASSAANTVPSGRQTVYSVTTSSSNASRTSSQRRREIAFQRLQDEYELQVKLDEGKLALERKALELKEIRQRKLIEERYKAMEEIVSFGSSAHTRIDTTKSVDPVADPEDSDHSERVSSWLGEQRRQNYKPQTLSADVDPALVTETLGANISLPINEKELRHLNGQQKNKVNVYKQTEPNTNYDYRASNSRSREGTFTVERTTQNSAPRTSVTPAYHWDFSNPTNQTYDGRNKTTKIPDGQTFENNRDVLIPKNPRISQQITHVRGAIPQQDRGPYGSLQPKIYDREGRNSNHYQQTQQVDERFDTSNKVNTNRISRPQ